MSDVAPSTQTLRLVVEYDGTAYSGWQIQAGPDAPKTVQGELKAALEALCREPVRVRGASRTDAGVHARGQVAAFDTTRLNIPPIGFERGLRGHLPYDIVIRKAEAAELGWDPRRTSRGKRYVYRIWNARTPTALDRQRTWWVRPPLDLDAMNAAAEVLHGTHDFEAFRASGCVAKHAVRTMYRIQARRGPHDTVEIEVIGNAFVRNMVRIFAGTLVDAGLGRMDVAGMRAALESLDRAKTGVTAPPQGLSLEEVIYDERLPARPKDDVDIEASKDSEI